MKKKRCIVCHRKADVYIVYANAAFCREHFIEFYERKILRTLKEAKFEGRRVLVAVSGGKDSVALLYALTSLAEALNIQIAALHIDLRIGNYSEESVAIVEKIAHELKIPIRIVDVRDFLGVGLPEATRVTKRPACAVCGIVKRWIMNKIAYENGFDYIATGHNIDDISAFWLKALLTQREEDIIRDFSIVTPPNPDYRIVGRIRPQIFLREQENMLYCLFKHAPFIQEICPLSRGATLHRYKEIWGDILEVNPVSQINFVKSLLRLRERIEKPKINMTTCKICGFATTAKDSICAFCRLRLRIQSWKNSLS